MFKDWNLLPTYRQPFEFNSDAKEFGNHAIQQCQNHVTGLYARITITTWTWLNTFATLTVVMEVVISIETSKNILPEESMKIHLYPKTPGHSQRLGKPIISLSSTPSLAKFGLIDKNDRLIVSLNTYSKGFGFE